MSGFTGLEPILDELKTALTTYMPAKLDALEAALVPAIALDDLAEVAIGERENFNAFPAIALGPMWTDPLEDTGKTRLRQQHTAQLLLYVSDAKSQEDLTRRFLRYVRAVAEVLADRRDAGDFPFRLLFRGRRWSYGPLLSGGYQFMRTARLELLCEKEEDRS